MNIQRPSDELPTIELVRDLATDVKDLALHELHAAKLELKEEAAKAARAVVAAAVAGGLALVGVILLAQAAANALHNALAIELSLAQVLVGATLAVAAMGALLLSKQQADDVEVPPTSTKKHVKEDGKWLKQEVKSVMKSN